MSKIIKPDKSEVTFKYDSLGRRIEKSSDEKSMRFVWDGNTILHEYVSQNDSDKIENLVENSNQTDADMADNLVTWVFNDGFVPSAKITSEGHYSIISDYLGAPVEAYDDQGDRVWSAELDVYGRVKDYTGEKGFIPFRYQGQYDDVEIGLYYNRFRYYDPEQGNYTQIDPIGLAGGNPTLYGFVRNTNNSFDPFGLWSYYQLKDDLGNIVYHGITDRPIQVRLIEHANGNGNTSKKLFSQVSYLDALPDRIAARNLEGSALYHAFKADANLYNATRPVSEGFYHQYNGPDKIAKGRTFLTQAEIESQMKKAKTVNVDRGGKIKCPT
ncbi:RHS repeat domain-containing protein [Lysinibacillus telephonicus]|nr:RHS repeat-associated core domain-containing protein [Lysinibacillus telephonicus]